MYKVGIMLMGKPSKSPKKVKQIIIEVEAKTKIMDILTYLHQLKRIQDANVNVAIQKNGRSVSQSSTVAQILRHSKPINNIEQQQEDMNLSSQKIVFEDTKHQKHIKALLGEGKKKQIQKGEQRRMKQNKQINKQQQDQQPKKGFCCC